MSGIPELISEETGWVSESDNPSHLADAVARAIGSPREAAGKADAALNRLRREFALDLQVDRLLAVWADSPKSTFSQPSEAGA
jgi:hypothetical protein